MLRKKPFSASKYAKDMLTYRRGPLAASCSKPLIYMSMEANVAAWRFVMSSLAKNIGRGILFSFSITFASLIVHNA